MLANVKILSRVGFGKSEGFFVFFVKNECIDYVIRTVLVDCPAVLARFGVRANHHLYYYCSRLEECFISIDSSFNKCSMCCCLILVFDDWQKCYSILWLDSLRFSVASL